MAKNMRTCKICGKKYEYCGHCPSKNTIEPWRNLYCSEKCREVFNVLDNFASKKISKEEAKKKLESLGFDLSKVRDVHKAAVNIIFEDNKKEAELKTATDLTPIPEVKIGDPVVLEVPKLVEDKKPYKNFRPKPKFVNDKKKST